MEIKCFLIYLFINLKMFLFLNILSPFPQKYFEMLLTLIIIQNVSRAINQIIMISEGLRDTEDWSNDAENAGLPSQE